MNKKIKMLNNFEFMYPKINTKTKAFDYMLNNEEFYNYAKDLQFNHCILDLYKQFTRSKKIKSILC